MWMEQAAQKLRPAKCREMRGQSRAKETRE